MRSYLNGSINNPDAGILQWIASLGFTGTRQEFRMSDEWSHIRMILQTYQQVSELSPLFLLPFEEDEIDLADMHEFAETVANMLADYGFDRADCAIEYGNEPDIFSDQWRADPEILGESFVEAIPKLRAQCSNINIISPSISNITNHGFARRLYGPIVRKASDYAIGFHRYPAGNSHDAQRPYKSREEEWLSFRSIVDDGAPGREFWHTETGYSQAHERKKPFPLCFTKEQYRVSEEEQAQFAAWEYAWWNQVADVPTMCWYQLNDGPDPNARLDNYGIRRIDGEPKVIADAFEIINRTFTNT